MKSRQLFWLVPACVAVGGILLFREIYVVRLVQQSKVSFTVNKGMTVPMLAEQLANNHTIRSPWLFRFFLSWRGADKRIQAGDYTVEGPITIARIVEALGSSASRQERTITIIPGWDLRDIGEYLVNEGMVTEKHWFEIVGTPAKRQAFLFQLLTPTGEQFITLLKDKPADVSFEGYLAPDTYRIYVDVTAEQVVEKLIGQRAKQFTPEMLADIAKSGRSIHETLTMASLLEREVRHDEDKAKVADLFWRRFDSGWALQADSTVHYAVNKKGNVFTTAADRATKNPWNTYEYPGLPPGPICSPSLASIMAAIYPEKNDYWYFLTTFEGEAKYGRTLEEHNRNVAKYLR